MPDTAIQTELSNNGVHAYGSVETERFERQLARYFGREYSRWHQKKDLPESYGVSSFEGNMTTPVTRRNLLEQHYDGELRIFKSFLDRDYLAYTMAYYGESAREIQSACLSLEEAQRNKYQLIVERAQIEDGQHILDLGCGFGGFSKYLIEQFEHITVTAINPSCVQTNYIRECLKRAEHPLASRRFKLLQAFFDEVNDVQLPSRKFDRVVSLGLLEHINNMDALFQKIAGLLAPSGKCFHHCIVSKPTIPKLLDSTNTLIDAYFPGGRIWPFAEPLRHHTYLQPTSSWFVNGLNYWRTLECWHKRFWESIEQLYPSFISKNQIESWNKYFSLCKAMFVPFNGEMYGNGHYLYET
jgi:cyclopropane-fatty-acyl-phospholipid synthase